MEMNSAALLGGLLSGVQKAQRQKELDAIAAEDRKMKQKLLDFQIKDAERKAKKEDFLMNFIQMHMGMAPEFGYGAGISMDEGGFPISVDSSLPSQIGAPQIAGPGPVTGPEPSSGGGLLDSLVNMDPAIAAMVTSMGGPDLLGAQRMGMDKKRYNLQLGKKNYVDTNGQLIEMDVFGKPTGKVIPKDVEMVGEEITLPDGSKQKVFRPKYGTPNAIQTAPPPTTQTPNVSSETRDKLAIIDDAIDNVQSLVDTVDPSYIGLINNPRQKMGNLASGLFPSMGNPKFAEWQMVYERFKALDRNQLFGASLSTSEKAAYERAVASVTKGYDVFVAEAKKFLDMMRNKRGNMEKRATQPVKDIQDRVRVKINANGEVIQ